MLTLIHIYVAITKKINVLVLISFYDPIRSSTFQIPNKIYYNIFVLSNSSDTDDVIYSHINMIKKFLCICC